MVLAVVIPLALGLFPRCRARIGGRDPRRDPHRARRPRLGRPDRAIEVLAKLGVAFLLFLAGLELDFDQLRGHPLRFGLIVFAASVGLGPRRSRSRSGSPT